MCSLQSDRSVTPSLWKWILDCVQSCWTQTKRIYNVTTQTDPEHKVVRICSKCYSVKKTNMIRLYDILKQRNLRRLEHVLRMESERLLKLILYSKLCKGSRGIGRPKLRFKTLLNKTSKQRRSQLAAGRCTASRETDGEQWYSGYSSGRNRQTAYQSM